MVNPFLDQSNSHIAGRHDRVEGVGKDSELQQLTGDNRGRPRRIGEKNDDAASMSKRRQATRRLGEGGQPVVKNAPDVAQNCVVTIGNLAESCDLRRQPSHEGLG